MSRIARFIVDLKKLSSTTRSCRTLIKNSIKHHFDYKELSIDVDRISQLSVKDLIFNQLTTHEKLTKNADFDEKNQKISLNILTLRRQVKFSCNNVNVADFKQFVDDEKMLMIVDFCVSNVINYIIEKLHLKRKIDAKIDFNFDEMLLFMLFMMNKFLSERNSFVHIERITFSTFFFHKFDSFNNSRIRIVFMLKYHKHLMFYKDQRFARYFIFRYWVFNIQMHYHTNDYAKSFIKLNSNKMTIIEKFWILINDLNNHLKNMIIQKPVSFHDIRVF